MSLRQRIIVIAIAAVTTMMTRFLPFLVFNGSKKLSPYLEKIGRFLPAAIMGVLVIYCYRNLNFSHPRTAIFEIVAGLITVLVHLWKENMPLSIIVGTGSYMLMTTFLQ